MPNPDSQQSRVDTIREIATRYLGLALSDSLIETLSAGGSVSLDDLLQEHSLAEVGTTLIRIDLLSQSNFQCDPCPPGESGCKPICFQNPARLPLERSPLKFRIYLD